MGRRSCSIGGRGARGEAGSGDRQWRAALTCIAERAARAARVLRVATAAPTRCACAAFANARLLGRRRCAGLPASTALLATVGTLACRSASCAGDRWPGPRQRRPAAVTQAMARSLRRSAGRPRSIAARLSVSPGVSRCRRDRLFLAGPWSRASCALVAGALRSRSRSLFADAVAACRQSGARAALLCVLGALLAKVETWRAGTKMLGGEISTQLTGRVAVIEHLANGRVRLTIDVIGTATTGAALCARPRARFGAQDSGGHRGRVASSPASSG